MGDEKEVKKAMPARASESLQTRSASSGTDVSVTSQPAKPKEKRSN